MGPPQNVGIFPVSLFCRLRVAPLRTDFVTVRKGWRKVVVFVCACRSNFQRSIASVLCVG